MKYKVRFASGYEQITEGETPAAALRSVAEQLTAGTVRRDNLPGLRLVSAKWEGTLAGGSQVVVTAVVPKPGAVQPERVAADAIFAFARPYLARIANHGR